MAAHEITNWMWNGACAMIERAERLRRDFYQPGMGAEIAGWEPPVHVFATENGVQAPLPGVEARDLKLGTVGNVLVVSGARRLPDDARRRSIAPTFHWASLSVLSRSDRDRSSWIDGS